MRGIERVLLAPEARERLLRDGFVALPDCRLQIFSFLAEKCRVLRMGVGLRYLLSCKELRLAVRRNSVFVAGDPGSRQEDCAGVDAVPAHRGIRNLLSHLRQSVRRNGHGDLKLSWSDPDNPHLLVPSERSSSAEQESVPQQNSLSPQYPIPYSAQVSFGQWKFWPRGVTTRPTECPTSWMQTLAT